ncbi:hypothetical protein B9Z55_022646 [Caenorhabditis nigoni]|nr:hypothetical protein B9Z55_022646 [Caenorhabditis nigoni]
MFRNVWWIGAFVNPIGLSFIVIIRYPFITISNDLIPPFCVQCTMRRFKQKEFTTKNSAELWNDEYLQVKCNVETCKNLGKLSILYMNKSTQPFTNFITSITWPRALGVQPDVQANSVDLIVDADTSISEMTNFACVKEFKRTPVLHITFAFTNRAGKIKKFNKECKLPVFVNFFASTSDKTDEAANAKRHSKPVKPSVGEKSAKKKYIPPYNKYHTSYDRMVYEILEKEKNGLNLRQINAFAEKDYKTGRNFKACIRARVDAALHGIGRAPWIESTTGEMRGSLTLV